MLTLDRHGRQGGLAMTVAAPETVKTTAAGTRSFHTLPFGHGAAERTSVPGLRAPAFAAKNTFLRPPL